MYEIKLFRESNTILIPDVAIRGPNGSLRETFVLDTGAAYSMITWNMAVELGFDPGLARGTPIVTGNGTLHVPIINADSFEVGGIIVNNVRCICHDIPGLMDAAGLLGPE